MVPLPLFIGDVVYKDFNLNNVTITTLNRTGIAGIISV
jgi:hypothetical protein